MIDLPNYFIRKVSGYPAGIRMPKIGHYYETGNFVGRTLHDIKNMFSGKEGDPLSGGDYRYWCGIPPSSTAKKGFASCRCCGSVLVTKKLRTDHKKEGCGARLEEAFKMLRRTKECVICDLATHRKVYGLPMCSKDCEYEWEFVSTTPAVLRAALEVVIREEKK